MNIQTFILFIIVVVFCSSLDVAYSLNGLKSADLDDDPDSENFEKYNKEDERDAHIVTHSIKRLIVRPDYDKYPYIVKIKTGSNDEIDRDNNEIQIQYVSPKAFPKDKQHQEQGDGGPIAEEVMLKTSYIDLSKDTIVIPMGERGLGYPTKSMYVVLRKSSNKSVHYMNLAYIRHKLKQYTVEWSILDASLFGRSRIDQEFCRGGTCDIYHHLIGSCLISSHKCGQPLHGPPALINKYTWQTGSARIGRGVESDENNNMRSVTLNLGPGGSSTELRLSLAPQRHHNQDVHDGGGGEGWGHKKRKAEDAEEDGKKGDEEEERHIPNSIDLLMLKREEPSASSSSSSTNGNEAETEAHFENVLVGTRSIKSAMLDCNNCEKMGEFFNDYEEEPEFSRLVGETASTLRNDVDADIATEIENELFLKDNPQIPYVGFGHCNLSDLTENPANYSKEIEDIGKFFLTSMRLHCDQNSENRVRSMFTSRFKLLEIQEDFSVGMAHASPVLQYKILTVDEFRTLMTGAFMAKYIRLYREEYLRWKTGHLEFNVALIKVASDQGSSQREIWINDLYRFMALKEFILYGMGPQSKSGTPIEPSFHSFVTENEKRIKRLVQAYGVL
ncbi:hypothetical protein Fcan01_09225 [Folsomia candida]|uniref:Uncharacterized protein n=1 Tax=Folsomia candida TaxID=158441 RepID=A0A226EF15_FOLCA|nr:hypothetical protein Fcan01_09225 [Folsomia candida]